MRGTVQGKALNPMDQVYQVTITLQLSDWQVLVDQMRSMNGGNSYPAWQVIDGIEDVIKHAKEHFTATIEQK